MQVLLEHRLVEILLYGDNNCNEIANKPTTEATIAFIKLPERFDTKVKSGVDYSRQWCCLGITYTTFKTA